MVEETFMQSLPAFLWFFGDKKDKSSLHLYFHIFISIVLIQYLGNDTH